MAQTGIKELLEAGVHFGHQTRRWNPKMRRYIFGERGGIYIIDLLKTQQLLTHAQDFAAQIAHRGGTVLFVGTKKQARDAVKDVAEAAGMPYVNHRWLGGLLTNFQTISQRIRRLHDLERYEAEGQLALLPTRERLSAEADLAKLRANLGGVKHMQRPPDAMFVIDLKTEVIAVHEAQRLRIPIIGLVDTNCDPDGIDFVDPGQRRRDPLLRHHRPLDRRRRPRGQPPVPRRARSRPARTRPSSSAAPPRSRPAREAEEARRRAGRRRRGRGGRRRRGRGAGARGRGRPRGGRRRGGRRARPRRPGAGRGAGPRGGRPAAARRRGRDRPEGRDRGRARAARQRRGRVAGPGAARQRPHPRRRLPGGGADDGGHPRMSTPTISAAQVKALRSRPARA